MYRYIKFIGNFQKQFEELKTKEYSTGVAIVENPSDEEFDALLNMQESGEEITLDKFKEMIKDSDQFRHELSKLHKLFVEKYEGLKKIAADKDGDTDYINTQSEVYERMYQLAQWGIFDDATNQAIITANETAKKNLAFALLILNEVRSYIQEKIESGEDVDQLIEKAKDVTPDVIGKLDQSKSLEENMGVIFGS